MPSDPLQTGDFRRCAEFHGHVCPGLSIGYRAAQADLEKLHSLRSQDEELVAEVETDACGVDAVQVLTGCTFGKGNLVFRDRGKQAFTLFSRSTGQGVRASLRAGAFAPDSRQGELFDKMHANTATAEEERELWELQRDKSRKVLEKPVEELFSIQWVTRSMPDKAEIEGSETCDGCGEPTMASRMRRIGEAKYCLDCAGYRE
ncbi:MAG: TraR/DksA C4-type zinc finger protein [Desulfohalobiaceae bacterium]|nr:TraR/DksA C4-type zinc finger protein [Desulfohalobiaceae bacterium]